MPSWSQIIDEKVCRLCSCWRNASVNLRSNTSQTLKHALCGLDSRPCSCSSCIRLVKALLSLCNTIAKDHTLCGIGADSCSCKYLIAESTSVEFIITSGHLLTTKSCWSLTIRRSSCWCSHCRKAIIGNRSAVCENLRTIS